MYIKMLCTLQMHTLLRHHISMHMACMDISRHLVAMSHQAPVRGIRRLYPKVGSE
jgi:hypothetical protein